MNVILRNGENTASLEPLIRSVSYTLADCGVSGSTKSTNLSRTTVLNSRRNAEGTNTSMVYKPCINDTYPTSLTDDQNKYVVKAGTSLDLYICTTTSSTAVSSTVSSTNYDVCLRLTLPPVKCHYTSGSTHYNAPVTTTISAGSFRIRPTHPFSGSSWKYTTSQYASSFTASGIAWSDSFSDAQNVTVSGVTTGQASLYLSRYNLDYAGVERVQTSGYNGQAGWAECYLSYKAQGSVSGTTVSYEINTTYPIKVRIIKLLTSSDFGNDRFFIGTKCPSQIYITNASNTPVAVREVWLGNVKVWPFNGGDATIASPTVKMQLRLKGFRFYSIADQNTLLGTINDGSVYASVRFKIAKNGSTSNTTYYDSYVNTCAIRGKYACPYYAGTTNSRICLSTTGSKTIEWTWNTGNSDWYHSTSCSGSECKNYLSNVSPFDELTVYLNFLLPCPKLSGTYSSASSDSFTFFGESGARTNIARGKFGGKLYPLSTIYKIAAKEVYDNINLIANSNASFTNGTYVSNHGYYLRRGELGLSTVYTTYLGNTSIIVDSDIYVDVKLPVENTPDVTINPPSSTSYVTPTFTKATLIGSFTLDDEKGSSSVYRPLSGSKDISVSRSTSTPMTSGMVEISNTDTGNATLILTYYYSNVNVTCPSTGTCDLSITKVCQTSHLEYTNGNGGWTRVKPYFVTDVRSVNDTGYSSGASKGNFYGKPTSSTAVSDISFELCMFRVKHIEQVILTSPSHDLWGGLVGWNYTYKYIEYTSEDTAFFTAYQTVNGNKCAIGTVAVTGQGGSYSG